LFLAVTATLGVDIGWKPLPGGGFEYIIQVEPQVLSALQNGSDIGGDIPPEIARNIRSFRVTLGTGRAPRVGDPAAAPPQERAAANEPQAAATDRSTGVDASIDRRSPASAAEAESDPPFPRRRYESDTELPARSEPPGSAASDHERGAADERGGEPTPAEAPPVDWPPRREPPNYPPLDAQSQPNEPPAESPPAIANNRYNDRLGSEPPKTFKADPGVQPIQHATGFRDDARTRYGVGPSTQGSNPFANANVPSPGSTRPATQSQTSAARQPAAAEAPTRPWFPFTAALLGLFISLGGNVYLGSLAWNYRNRCLAMLGRGRRQPARRPHFRYEEEDEDQEVQAVED
jgi:hypothetical protein